MFTGIAELPFRATDEIRDPPITRAQDHATAAGEQRARSRRIRRVT
ncbi:MAG: hypothetical protein JWN62_1845 [Acidimicrobiales bacterium]|nr:hypothetical protein [Acidimicrobiales bacterium]